MKQVTGVDAKLTSGTHISYWTDTVNAPVAFKPLKENIETDVVIVGGGIAGLSIAYNLLNEGKKVVVIEDGFIGSGETGRTTAHLVNALDDRYYTLESLFGPSTCKLIAASHTAAIDFVEQTIQKENIDCDFERLPGYLFRHPTAPVDELDKELQATQRAGIETELVDHVPGIKNYPGKGILFPSQAQFHPMKYLVGLAKAITEKGGRIFTETHAAEIDDKGITSKTGFQVKAAHVVIATNTPVNNRYIMHLRQFPYRTYVIGALVKKGLLPRALWWDTGDEEVNKEVPPYHYVRCHPYNNEYDLLISGGEDHPTGLTEDLHVPEEHRYTLLEDWTRTHFPVLNTIYRWSGQVMEPMDSLAYIGRNPFDSDNIYIVTGDSGNGMTHGTIAGMLITDLMMGRENKWEKIYSPWRLKLKSSGTFFREFFGGLFAHLKQSPNDKDKLELDSLNKGEGRITEIRGEKFGIYRDEDLQLHIISPECTHLKCTVAWNNDEKTWDCPCHGSRFTFDGKVINGPANADLKSFSGSLKELSDND
ncbi:MAG: FAD-dependent oxidoreductase [Chitinophagales bacterium]